MKLILKKGRTCMVSGASWDGLVTENAMQVLSLGEI
jgi:hypothetical protein